MSNCRKEKMILSNRDLLEIKGGGKIGFGSVLFLIVGGLVTLLAGIIDGLTNPKKCNITK